MLIVDTLYILRYERLVRHPLISGYNHSTKKVHFYLPKHHCTYIKIYKYHKENPVQSYICNKEINIPLTVIVFPFLCTPSYLDVVESLHQNLMMLITSSGRSQSPGTVVPLSTFFCGQNNGVVLNQPRHY